MKYSLEMSFFVDAFCFATRVDAALLRFCTLVNVFARRAHFVIRDIVSQMAVASKRKMYD